MAPASALAACAKGSAERSMSRTRLPRRASVSACQRPTMPAPATVMVGVFMPFTRSGASLAPRHALAPRIGSALQHAVLADDYGVRAGGEQVGAHAVSIGLHLQRMPDGRSMVNLDLERAAAAAEVHERGGGLRVELPVDQRDQGFHHVEDDAAAAGRAERRPVPALFV